MGFYSVVAGDVVLSRSGDFCGLLQSSMHSLCP